MYLALKQGKERDYNTFPPLSPIIKISNKLIKISLEKCNLQSFPIGFKPKLSPT
jgi:hypothetical protein